VEPKGGRHFTTAAPNRSGAEFARMVEHVVRPYPAADTIHLVMDSLNIHCRKSSTGHFGEQKGEGIWDRLSVHYTPKHGSWLDFRRSKTWRSDRVISSPALAGQ
jgi:hypothetical protein